MICEITISFVYLRQKNKGGGGLLRNAYFTFLEIVNSKIFKEQLHLWYIMFHPKKME